MIGIFSPISYMNFRTQCAGVYSPYFGGYSPFSLFSGIMPYYGNMGSCYYGNNFMYNRFYPNMFALNYALPGYWHTGYLNNAYDSTSSSTSSSSVSSSTSKTSSFGANVTNPVKTTNSSAAVESGNKNPAKVLSGKEIVDVAEKYLNCSENDGSHLKFCINDTCRYEDPRNEEWCTDFVTYVVKEAYANKGSTPPPGFGDHDVKTMKNWAVRNGYFIKTSDMPKKGKYISENIKAGDIMIINENGASHTGFVTKVDSNGVIHTIEGNRDDRVKQHSYSPDYPDLSGFIKLTS